ncbi:hypothetical protein [Nonomuraea typhae]|uniref:hypothetical protein n=1 Tax=Nonomuraea typhae TaxID=2603600 RepID=UPI0012FB7584|nr:hypothetical protein [Nonomuraea typhae]
MVVPEPIPGFEATVRDRLAAIMLNPWRVPSVTCATCTHPIGAQYEWCYQCNRDQREFGTAIARLVVPLTYSVVGAQSDSDMYRYKDAMGEHLRAQNPSFQRVLLLALGFSVTHAPCLDRVSTSPVSCLATVPSLSGRAGAHPLNRISSVLPEHWRRVEVAAAPGVPESERRKIRARHFSLPSPRDVAGRHVVVFDDTWVKGGHAQSVAAALRQAGAAEVTVVVIARRIDPRNQLPFVEDVARRVLTPREYTLATCPVTGDRCS